MRADEWAGWITIAGFLVFIVALLVAACFAGSQLGDALAGLVTVSR